MGHGDSPPAESLPIKLSRVLGQVCAIMTKNILLRPLLLILGVMILLGCGSSSFRPPVVNPAALSGANMNLVFVVSEDLAYHAPGDINAATGNLTSQGLARSLSLGTFLKTQVLGSANVAGIYALEPMTHLQTAAGLPDMSAVGTIQQFAMMNQVTLTIDQGSSVFYPGNSFPINASYATVPLPSGVAPPLVACSACQGLDYSDVNGDNETLVSTILNSGVAGFYVFVAPWETIHPLMSSINSQHGFNLAAPTVYAGPNTIYSISVSASGAASLSVYNTNANPLPAYPTLPPGIVHTSVRAQPFFTLTVTAGVGGAVVPPGINTNETVYWIRHAEAHPDDNWDDGNLVAAGQWRALDLPNSLSGKIHPTQVWSIDGAQVIPGTTDGAGRELWSYIRTDLTVEPYAIANNLPYNLASGFELGAQNPPQLSSQASDFFFTGGRFSGQKILVAWEHEHIPTTVNALLASYYPNGGGISAPTNWPNTDYDTVWTVTIDAKGNVTVDDSIFQRIDSKLLPKTAPAF
jgi:hypothetical protein